MIQSLLDRFDERGRALPANRLAMGVRDGRIAELEAQLADSAARIKLLEAGIVNRRIYCRCGAEEFAKGIADVKYKG